MFCFGDKREFIKKILNFFQLSELMNYFKINSVILVRFRESSLASALIESFHFSS